MNKINYKIAIRIICLIAIFTINFQYFAFSQNDNLKIFKKSSSIDFCYATNYLLKSQIINKNNISEVEIHEKKTLFYALLNLYNSDKNIEKQSFFECFSNINNKNLLLNKEQKDFLTEKFYKKVKKSIKKQINKKGFYNDSLQNIIIKQFIKYDKEKVLTYEDLFNNQNSNALYRKYSVKPNDFYSFVTDTSKRIYDRIAINSSIDSDSNEKYINIPPNEKEELIDYAIKNGFKVGLLLEQSNSKGKTNYFFIVAEKIIKNKRYNAFVVKYWENQKPKTALLSRKAVLTYTREICIYKYGARIILDKIIK